MNAKFVTAEEGQFLWACGYGISPDIDPENLDAAYALLNWYTSPEAELYEAATWNYQIANQKVLDIAPQSVIDAAIARTRRSTWRTRSPRARPRTATRGSPRGPR